MTPRALKSKKHGISYAKWGYRFIAPFFLVFAVFQLIPLLSTIYYSFFEFYRSGLKEIGPNFVGLENYRQLFATDLPKYMGNTVLMWIIGFVPQIIISLLLAAWFTDMRIRMRAQGFLKTVIYMPNLIMASAFAMLFFALFSDNGPINSLLLSFGWISEPIRYLSNVWTVRSLVGLMNFFNVVRQHDDSADGGSDGRGHRVVRGGRNRRLYVQPDVLENHDAADPADFGLCRHHLDDWRPADV